MTTDVHVEQRWLDIPPVFGMTVREASERLAEAGFTPVASTRRFSADAGDIVGGTLPPEGAALRRTARIDLLPAPKEAVAKSADESLTVDQVLDLGIMPDFTGFSVNEALALVQARGFHTWPRGAFTDKVEPDFVVFTEPRPGMAMNFDPIVIWYAIPVPLPDPLPDPLTDLTPATTPGTPDAPEELIDRGIAGPPMSPPAGQGLPISRTRTGPKRGTPCPSRFPASGSTVRPSRPRSTTRRSSRTRASATSPATGRTCPRR